MLLLLLLFLSHCGYWLRSSAPATTRRRSAMPRPTMAPPRVSYAGWKYVEYFRRNNPENVVPDRGAAVPTKFQSFISVPRLFWVETLPQCRIYGSCDREPTDVYVFISLQQYYVGRALLRTHSIYHRSTLLSFTNTDSTLDRLACEFIFVGRGRTTTPSSCGYCCFVGSTLTKNQPRSPPKTGTPLLHRSPLVVFSS